MWFSSGQKEVLEFVKGETKLSIADQLRMLIDYGYKKEIIGYWFPMASGKVGS